MPFGNNHTLINCKMTVAHEIVLKSLSNPCDYLHSITKIQLSFNRKKKLWNKVHYAFSTVIVHYLLCLHVELSSSPALFVFPCSIMQLGVYCYGYNTETTASSEPHTCHEISSHVLNYLMHQANCQQVKNKLAANSVVCGLTSKWRVCG